MTDVSLPVPSPVDLSALEPSVRALLEAPTQASGRFANPWEAPPRPGLRDVFRWQMQRDRGGKRVVAQPMAEAPLGALSALPDDLRVLWLGHASFLVEIEGTRLLVDPVFGRAGGLVARVTDLPITVDALPRPHAVLLTHGHHDHFDSRSVRALARRFGPELLFVVPRGIARELPAECRRVVELDWWREIAIESARVCLVPAQHWHRRGLFDEDRALWGGYVMRGHGPSSRSVYHSGDTGYFQGFDAIGRVFPSIDVAILPLGAYEPRWFMGSQHMPPEASALAFADLGAKHFVGMHWGTFDLSDENVDDGPRLLERVVDEDARLDARRFHVLRHGGSVGVDGRGELAALGEARF
jgi:L-ascorbate metabolism protein UlaG (beta-lactamase superfamily)